MPTLKKSRTKKPARKTTRRKSAKKDTGFLASVNDAWTRVSRAAIASSVLIALIAVAFLWTGGYVGLLGERLSRFAGAGAVNAGFEIQRITARGLNQANDDDVLAAVGPVIGTSILHFNPDHARASVEQIGWVRSAAVTRLMPNTIHVSVREREPAAVWQLSGDLHLIDDTGAVIREVNAFEYADLPLIVGAGAPGAASEMLQALQAEPDLWGRASALIRVSDRRWNMKTKDGIDVKFPETGEAKAVHYLARLQAETHLLDEPLEYVDLRNNDNFVYRKKGGMEVDAPLGRVR